MSGSSPSVAPEAVTPFAVGTTSPSPRDGHPARNTFIVVAVVAVLIVGFLAATGAFSGPTSSEAVSSSGAQSTAAADLPPGSWSLAVMAGYDAWNGTSLSLNLSSLPPNCTASSPSGSVPASIAVPSFRGNISDGSAAFWILEYVQPSGHSLAVVFVTDGSVAAIVVLSGADCSPYPSGFAGIPANAVSSSTAAQALDTAGATAFLAAHRAGQSLLMDLSAFNGTDEWLFEFTPCSGILTGNLSGPTSGAAFYGVVNATTGSVVSAVPTSSECELSVPSGIGSVFALGVPTVVTGAGSGGTVASQGCASGDYCYEIPVETAEDNVSGGDMSLSVENGSHPPPNLSSTPLGYAFTDPSGRVIVYALGSVETSWTDGTGDANTPLTAGDTLWIDMGTSDPTGHGYELTIQGEGPYANSGEGFGLP